jgi:hypothetical protein
VMTFLILMTFFEGFGISSVNERWIGFMGTGVNNSDRRLLSSKKRGPREPK